ncbi:MAG TPA: DUF1648 domain-containing protein [Candidatus Edwardsbacteria bacterium]|nr:DUF1648 domain-containing protein [Candidatus Edwardsbacteria bacterium]
MDGGRPRLTPQPTDLDAMLESAGWLALAALWGLAAYWYATLPAVVPTHFNGAGQVNAYGPKGTIFILPVVGSAMFAVMTLLNRFPHAFNYPVAITAANAPQQYLLATRLLRFLKLAIIAVFCALLAFIHRAAAGAAGGIPGWFLPLIIAACLLPTVWYLVASAKAK